MLLCLLPVDWHIQHVVKWKKNTDFDLVEYPAITISDFSPKSGRPGTPIAITGTNFGQYPEAAEVTFDGVDGLVSSCTDNEMIVSVPEGGSTGTLKVKVWLSEHEFTEEFVVVPGAVIASFSATSGSAGYIITVEGDNFGTDANDVEISINGVDAEIVSITNTEIQFRVPDTETGALILVFDKQQVIEGPIFLVGIVKVTGTLFGHEGSWGDNPDTEITAGVDGDISTFIDGGSSEGYIGYEVADEYGVILTTIRYAPRSSHPGRMVGAEIRGTNDPLNVATPSEGDYEVLYTITEEPATETYTVVNLTPGDAVYKYIYYYTETGNGNLAEIEFYGKIEEPKMVGTLIGHEGSWNNNPDTYITAAVDGDINTFVDGVAEVNFVGYDYGNSHSALVTKFRYAPRSTHASRMVGGEVRGSNDPDYLNNYVVLHTIESEPPAGEYSEAKISDETTYRYVYYMGQNCNVAEVEFYGLLK